MRETIYGVELKASEYRPQRSVIAEPTQTAGGNILLRVGIENDNQPGWHQTEHVVMAASEAMEFAIAILNTIPVRS